MEAKKGTQLDHLGEGEFSVLDYLNNHNLRRNSREHGGMFRLEYYVLTQRITNLQS
jgi:hypothetical protein